MYDPNQRGEVQDYTDAFLATFCVIVFMALATLWALFGMIPTLAAAWVSLKGLGWAAARR